MHFMFRTFAALIATAALLISGSMPASAAAPEPRIGSPSIEWAPIGEKGGIGMPYVYCAGYTAEPRVRTAVTNLQTGERRVFTWTGAYPNAYFPRLPVGRYRVGTEASCRGRKAYRVQTVRIWPKSAATTISWDEFKRIRGGMSRSQVTSIVGHAGQGFVEAGAVTVTYNTMSYGGLTLVEFIGGRVKSKYWDIPHD